MVAYRKGDRTSHVLIRLIEDWTKALGNSLFTGAVLMDLSEALDCIRHDLLIAKLHIYALMFDTATFIYSYLKKGNKT